jgi:aminoglycoside phosphotransferase (APT) family kinase protein
MIKTLKRNALESYLTTLLGKEVRIERIESLGKGSHGQGFRVDLITGKTTKRLILKALRGDIGLGHDYPSDRAAVLLLAKKSYNALPHHVKAIDVATIKRDDSIRTVEEGRDFFLVMEEAIGENYFRDMERMRGKVELDSHDRMRIKTMVKYLSDIHSIKPVPSLDEIRGQGKRSRNLYLRKIRDIIGHGECLMGVLDTYGDVTFTTPEEMAVIEKKCIEWRMRLKPKWKRLCQIHGDFHPGNIWFRSDNDFTVLDRSRGPWGDAADDITALSINYIFFSLNYYGRFGKPYDEALRLFYDEYIKITGDKELLEVVAPFYAFRGVVVANPLFYPKVRDENRRKILRFIRWVLNSERFNPSSPVPPSLTRPSQSGRG